MSTTLHHLDHDDDVEAAACRVYDAECALHAAHQSHIDSWVAAASDKLHQAIEGYLRAQTAHH